MYTPPVGFTDVGGLTVDLATEEVPEGGENRFIQRYPVRAKYPDLVLKRGLMKQTAIWDWVKQCIETLTIEPHDVDVTLLNASHQPLMTWHLVGAYPVKWAVSDLSATANAYVVESLQLAYQYFTLDKS